MHPVVLLAKRAVETYIKERTIINDFNDLPEEFRKKRAGAFVSIENHGRLRGCIGTYLPTKDNIAQEIVSNAISAAKEDYRFGSVTEAELPEVSYTVYVLHEPELAKNINQLDPKKFGILVRTAPISYQKSHETVFGGSLSFKSGLLLPDLEGINTAQEQIEIACEKGGIDPSLEQIIIYRFAAEKYE